MITMLQALSKLVEMAVAGVVLEKLVKEYWVLFSDSFVVPLFNAVVVLQVTH